MLNKILVIDDEQVVIDAISESLEGEGYEILSAQNGEEGLALYYEKKPILIILDLRMPVMDGIKFLERIRMSPAELSSIIVLTGHGDEEEMKKCFALGVGAFLRKPFNIHELRGMVRNSIELKQTQHDLIEEISERKKIEEELRMFRNNLEKQVENRTSELLITNEQLGKEIYERKQLEDKLKQKLDDVERLNRLMVGRELKMEEMRRDLMQLRKQVEELERNDSHG